MVMASISRSDNGTDRGVGEGVSVRYYHSGCPNCRNPKFIEFSNGLAIISCKYCGVLKRMSEADYLREQAQRHKENGGI